MTKKRRNLVDGRNYHYTYRITNIVEKKYYYGVHSCDCLPKEDIGVKYFSTSKNKAFKQDIKDNPQNYKYKVIKIFSTRIEAVNHEIFLHKKFNVKLHKSFYNDSNQTSAKFDTSGKGNYIDENGNSIFLCVIEAKERNLKGRACDELTKTYFSSLYKNKTYEELYGIEKANIMKKTLSESQTGKKRSEEFKINASLRLMGDKNPMYGKTHSEETKFLYSVQRTGDKNPMYGKTHSEETKQKISKTKQGSASPNKGKKAKTIECEHCGKEISTGNHTRWHGDNCKHKGEING